MSGELLPRSEDGGGGTIAIDLYLDVSESMRGFAAVDTSSYLRVLRQVLDQVTTADYDLRPFSFSERTELITPFSWDRIKNPLFYSGASTDLPSLLESIAEDSSRTSISVVVSDLVVSMINEDEYSTVTALNAILHKCEETLLLGFRSEFIGTYFIETPPKGRIDNVDLRLEDKHSGRPFFLLIVANSTEMLERFSRTTLDSLEVSLRYNPRDYPVLVENVKPYDCYENRENEIRIFDVPEWSVDESGYSRYTGTFVHLNASNQEKSRLCLQMRFGGDLKIWSLDALDCRCWHTRYAREGIWDAKRSVRIDQMTVVDSLEKGVAILAYDFPSLERNTWDAFLISFRPGEGNLRFPEWVSSWSTRDDRERSELSRTLYLELLIRAMQNSVLDELRFHDQVIFLTRS
ncbi:MAG: hypothetical protein KJ970_00020 [Candidatus Eisenbacteria bacterium]|uniref:Uncharacterized protein n=1 Tax=Eiseniibacteriota bacterium TaxID=2212470 RepID=A0A948RRJ6_UNCEI|nr:hypothetical protein [Candidatus Eisenbacteria bacterium]MBU2689286.1 hypothetical protein [Candidatus Eisenbacteria bacterium]